MAKVAMVRINLDDAFTLIGKLSWEIEQMEKYQAERRTAGKELSPLLAEGLARDREIHARMRKQLGCE